MNTSKRGKDAEDLVARQLAGRGWQILARNWKLPVCEIDIIGQKKGIIYFIEVKLRARSYQGDGLEYITSAKLKKLKFAAALWCQINHWRGDYRILGVSVDEAEGIRMKEVVDLA